MTVNANRVIVTTEEYALRAIHGLSVHHCDYPEIRCEGRSAEDAAARLAEHLSRTLDNAPSDWRRENLMHAIEDVRVFASRDGR
jgi:hypothetical protein